MLHIVIMANIFHDSNFPIHEVYDLKGSWVDRGGKKLKKGKKPPSVKKDKDLTYNFSVGPQIREGMLEVISRDARMLRDVNIMGNFISQTTNQFANI